MKIKYILFATFLIAFSSMRSFASNPTSKGWTIKDPFLQKVFIENNGQFNGHDKIDNSKILFTVDNEGARVFFTSQGLTYLIQKMNREHESEDKNEREEDELKIISDYVHMQWLGANSNAAVIAENKVNDYYTYADSKVENGTIIANAFKTITYKNLYEGIDVIYSFPESEGIKYTIVIHPGADVSKIKMNYTDADKLSIDKEGNLHLRTKIGDIIDHAPESFYENSKQAINSSFVLNGNEIAFQVAAYDKSKTLVIDPWTINPNFSGQNSGWDIDKDGQGNIYCQGGDWPYYLKKFSSTGTLIWTFTYPNSTPYMGDHATTNAGFNYISYGPWIGPYFSKIDPAGSIVFNNTTTNIEYPQGEMYRITLNCKTGELYGAGFAYDGISLSYYTNICSIDTSNGKFSNYKTLYSTAVETRSLCYDPAGGFVYALVVPVDGATNPTDGNRIIKSTNLLDPVFNVKSNYSIMETSPTYTPSWFNGFNGIAVGCYLYTCDGQTLKKWDKETGVQIGSSVTIPSGGVQANSGLYLDQCGNIYCGSNKTIIKYDASLTQLSTATTDGKVFDICAGIIDGEILACGEKFISSIDMDVCTNINVQFTTVESNPCSCTGAATAFVVGSCDSSFSYSWSNGSTGTTLTDLCPGTYTVTVVDTSVCQNVSAVATVTVEGNNSSLPSIQILTTLACEGECNGTATSVINGGTPPFTYVWSNGQSSEVLTGLCAGSYSVSITDVYGCTGSQSFTINTSPPISVTTSSTNATCNNNDGTISIVVSGGTPPLNYIWSNGASTPDLTGLGEGTYNLIVTDVAGCSQTYEVSVGKDELLVGSFSFNFPDQCYPQLVQFTNTSTDAVSSHWNFGDTATSIEVNPLYSYNDKGDYTVTLVITNADGCVDSVTTSVNIPDVYVDAKMPNAFSPNDDGKNDSFKPLMKCTGNLSYVFKVFNRWGEIVFESNSPSESWNGKYKGEPVPLGVYVYYLQYSCDNCDEFLKGNVTLVR